MPLIHCPDCNKEISESAISCPHCGLPRPIYELQNRARRQQDAEALEEEKAKVRWMWGGAFAAFLIGAGFLIGALTSDWSFAALGKKAMWIGIAVIFEFAAYWLWMTASGIQRGMKTRFKE
jgi:hypothetical protein